MDDQTSPNILVLPSECSIYVVEQWRQSFVENLQSNNKEFILDFADVEKLDSCFMQLLLALKKQIVDMDGSLRIENIKDSVIEKLRATYISDILLSPSVTN